MPISAERANTELAELYETYRTAALNKEYYGAMLARFQRINTIIEITIALGATSSGISGLAVVTQYPQAKWLWGIITAASAVLAISKPILQLNRKIERYSRLFTGHLDIYLTLSALVSRVRRKREISEEMIKQFEKVEQRYFELSRGDDPIVKAKLLNRCRDAVVKRIPDTVLWFDTTNDQANITAIGRAPERIARVKDA
jgi:choline-glycine betaine transporter